MASFLMIHGGYHGGWAYDALRAPLEALGHVMAAPTLPGMDGNPGAIRAVSLARWTDFAVAEARKLTGPVILCGHSRAGIVVSEAAECAPDAFAASVYLAAYVVPSGLSLKDYLDDHPLPATLEKGWSLYGRAPAFVLDPLVAGEHFYSLCTPKDRAEAVARLVPEPIVPMSTPLHLTDDRFGSVPRHYIECQFDDTVPIALQRTMREGLDWVSVSTLFSDHSPFLSMPDKLAAALHSIAERIET